MAIASWLTTFNGEEMHGADDYWMAIYKEYLRWRAKEIVEVAEPFVNRCSTAQSPPSFTHEQPTWWACLVYQRMSNLELVLSRKKSVKDATPQNIAGIPIEEDEQEGSDDADEAEEQNDDNHDHHNDGDDMDLGKAA